MNVSHWYYIAIHLNVFKRVLWTPQRVVFKFKITNELGKEMDTDGCTWPGQTCCLIPTT